MVDWNADLLTNCNGAKFVRRLANELSLQIVQHNPTHITHTSATCIDAILVDDNDEVLESNTIPANYHNGHNIIDVLISSPTYGQSRNVIKYRDYKNINAKDLQSYLANCDWSPYSTGESNDPDLLLQCLNTNLNNAIETGRENRLGLTVRYCNCIRNEMLLTDATTGQGTNTISRTSSRYAKKQNKKQ